MRNECDLLIYTIYSINALFHRFIIKHSTSEAYFTFNRNFVLSVLQLAQKLLLRSHYTTQFTTLGTREGKSTVADGDDWYKPFRNCLKKVCKCCQGQEESEQFRLSHQGKRGSIIEGRTNITVELSNSSSKVPSILISISMYLNLYLYLYLSRSSA